MRATAYRIRGRLASAFVRAIRSEMTRRENLMTIHPLARRIVCVVTLTASLMVTLVMTGCNTVKGFGQDVQNAAEGTEKVIDKATR